MSEVKVAENLKVVKQNIIDACKRAGRDPEEVTLIAVSKTKPVELIMEAYNEGIRDFGENKVQELTKKMEEMPKDINWHLIGHLQKNKVKYVAGNVTLIHSVDSYELAEEISKQCVKREKTQDILVEINIGDEESKFGVAYDDAEELVYKIIGLPNISVKGLMCIAPIAVNYEENRKFFKKMIKKVVDINYNMGDNVNHEKSRSDFHGLTSGFSQEIRESNPSSGIPLSILSFGMTNDYIAAVEEGSTMVRVGTGIFGERDYNK